MSKFIVTLSILFCFVAGAKEQARPMDQMHGDCSNYKMSLEKEMGLWSSKPIVSEKSIEVDVMHSLALKPQNQIQFPVTPEKFFSKEDSKYAGVFSFKVPSDGVYKISSGSKLWFDVASENTKTLVPTKEFEMQTQCLKVFKVVTFELKKKENYVLQVNSSSAPANLFLITKE